jgi:endonuclease III
MLSRYSTRAGVNAEASRFASQGGELASFLSVELSPLSSLIHLRDFYDSKADSVRGEIEVPSRAYGLHRLKVLLEEKSM